VTEPAHSTNKSGGRPFTLLWCEKDTVINQAIEENELSHFSVSVPKAAEEVEIHDLRIHPLYATNCIKCGQWLGLQTPGRVMPVDRGSGAGAAAGSTQLLARHGITAWTRPAGVELVSSS
jgi:hypothetical protein